jgi:pimeloyl-ACP methyl ester carboxylesterase
MYLLSTLLLRQDYLHRATVTRPQQFMGHFSQMAAGLTHHVQPERLRDISRNIPKVTLVTGDEDHLIRIENSFKLKEAMPEAELVQFKETGHGIHTQRKKEFNKLIQRTIKEGDERLAKGWTPEKGWAP